MPPRRTLVIAAVATPVALLLALWLLLRFGAFDGAIARSVSRTLGTPVTFDGLSLGLLGRPRLGIDGLKLGETGADGRLVEGTAVEAVLPWATLLGGPMRVDAVTLRGGTATLSVDATGKDNWTALVERVIELAGPGPSAFDVGRLDVEDLKLRYVDHAADVNVRVAGLTLGASDLAPARPFPAELRLAVSFDPWSAHGKFAGRAVLDPDRSRYGLELDRFLFWVGGGALPLAGVEASGKLAGLDYDMGADRATFKRVQGNLAGAAFEAAGHVDRVTTEPAATFDLRFAPFSPRAFVQALGGELPATTDPQRLERAEFNATVAASAARIAVTGLEGRLDDTSFAGQLHLPVEPPGPPRVELHMDRIALDGYLPADVNAKQVARDAKRAVKNGDATLEALLASLRKFDLDATLTIDDASAFDSRWHGLKIRIEPNAAVGRGR